MNIIQVCNALDDIKIQELVISTNLLVKVNSYLDPDNQIDFKLSGVEVIRELDKLDVDKQTYADLISEVLSPEDTHAFKKALAILKEQNSQKENISTQTKHTTVIIIVTVTVATLLAGCLVLYLSTRGVDVETSSTFISAFVEIMKAILEFSNAE